MYPPNPSSPLKSPAKFDQQAVCHIRTFHCLLSRHIEESFKKESRENEHATERNVPRGEEEATVYILPAEWMIFPCSLTRCRNRRGKESTCCDSTDDSLIWPRECSKEVIARKRLERSQQRDGVLVDMRELAAEMTKFAAEQSAEEERFVTSLVVVVHNEHTTDTQQHPHSAATNPPPQPTPQIPTAFCPQTCSLGQLLK